MRLKHLLQFVLVFMMSAGIFGCSSTRYYEFSNTGGSYHPSKLKATEAPPAEAVTQADAPAVAEAEPVVEASTAAMPAVVAKPAPVWKVAPAAAVSEKSVTPQPVTTPSVAPADYTKPAFAPNAQVKKAKKKGLFAKIKALKADVLEIILAIFLPPIAVLLHDGVGTYFWISIILTLLFWLPGVIFALLVVTDNV